MDKSRAEKKHVEQQESTTGNPVWLRLRESMERLQTLGRQTIDADALAQKLAGRAKMLRGRLVATETEQVPLVFLGFTKNWERYGIPIADVLEVQALEQFTVVPQTPPFLRGVVHWRGAILSLLDLSRLFEIPETGLADLHFYLVVEAAGRRVGVVAREIEEVYSVPHSRISTAPPRPATLPAEWVLGVHDNQRLILNMASILQDVRLVEWIKKL